MVKIQWHKWHQYAGLKLSILLAFIFITGTVSTISHEIDWLVNEDRRISTAHDNNSLDWDKALAAAKTHKPDWLIEHIHQPLNSYSTIEIIGLTPQGERRRLYINPHDYSVTGEASWLNVQRFLRDSHRRLFIMNSWGLLLVTSLSLLVLTSLVTGVMTYKKFWRGFFKRPRLSKGRRLFWGDMHRLTAVWSLWFIALVGLTGFWYLIEASLEKWGDDPSVYARQGYENTAVQASKTIQDKINTIHSLDPNFVVTTIKLPISLDSPLEIQGQSTAWLTRPRANLYAFDAKAGTLQYSINGKDLSLLGRIVEMADFLHFGTWGGLAGKLLYFIFGFGLSGLALSGIYIYSKRLNQTAITPALTGMGPFKYVALIIVGYWLLQIPAYSNTVINGRQLTGTLSDVKIAGCTGKIGIQNTSADLQQITLLLDPACALNYSWPRAGATLDQAKKFKLGSKGFKIKTSNKQDSFLYLIDQTKKVHRYQISTRQ